MKTLLNNWWIFGAQGIFLIAVGALAIINIDIDLVAFVQYLGLIFLGFGVILGLLGLRSRTKGKDWGFIFTMGVLQTILGLVILANPSSSSSVFALIMGVWALAMATIQFVLAAINKLNRIIFFINAIVSGVFGALIIWYDFDDQRSLTTLVGIYSVILGIAIVYYAIQLRMRKRIPSEIKEKPESNIPLKENSETIT